MRIARMLAISIVASAVLGQGAAAQDWQQKRQRPQNPPQAQPVPLATEGVSPAGSVSVTVTRPMVEVPPTFVTIRLYVPTVPRTNGSA